MAQGRARQPSAPVSCWRRVRRQEGASEAKGPEPGARGEASILSTSSSLVLTPFAERGWETGAGCAGPGPAGRGAGPRMVPVWFCLPPPHTQHVTSLGQPRK